MSTPCFFYENRAENFNQETGVCLAPKKIPAETCEARLNK